MSTEIQFDTESLFVLREGIVLEQEATLDTIVPFPIAQKFSGPNSTKIFGTRFYKVWANTTNEAMPKEKHRYSSRRTIHKQLQRAHGTTNAATRNDRPIDIDDLPDCQPVEVP
jgi:hypothetical protein